MFWGKGRSGREIAPEDIFLDSSNLPGRNEEQFEARMVRPVAPRAIFGVGIIFAALLVVFTAQAFRLEVLRGEVFADISRNNRLDRTVAFATRGVVFDRTGLELAWNEAQTSLSDATSTTENTSGVENRKVYAFRRYTDLPGLSHVLGFVRYPKADQSGVWWREEYAGVSGVELAFNERLAGENGSTMVEYNARGEIQQQNIVIPPEDGKDLLLSIDAEVQSKLYTTLSSHATRQGFRGGAAVIMDVETGEILALASFPEYDNQAFTDGELASITQTSESERSPLLNRAVSGLYAPGSIVKPIFAAAALAENIISPEKEVLSKGALSVPNPYDESKPSVFRDWTTHGLVDMREAIAVSSDEYFYTIGGGVSAETARFDGREVQRGLGIARLDEYATRFGLGQVSGVALFGEEAGVIPTPEWKESVFGVDDPWRLGNTYHTAIGQFGFQVTPLQAVRFIAAIANGGWLLTPHLELEQKADRSNARIPDTDLDVVRDGMRLAVTSTRPDATVKALNIPGIEIAAKTGTAELGSRNQWMHSWSVGYWPASNPKYAYAVVLEQAPAGTLSGAAPGLRPFFEWLIAEKPEYVH